MTRGMSSLLRARSSHQRLRQRRNYDVDDVVWISRRRGIAD